MPCRAQTLRDVPCSRPTRLARPYWPSIYKIAQESFRALLQGSWCTLGGIFGRKEFLRQTPVIYLCNFFSVRLQLSSLLNELAALCASALKFKKKKKKSWWIHVAINFQSACIQMKMKKKIPESMVHCFLSWKGRVNLKLLDTDKDSLSLSLVSPPVQSVQTDPDIMGNAANNIGGHATLSRSKNHRPTRACICRSPEP